MYKYIADTAFNLVKCVKVEGDEIEKLNILILVSETSSITHLFALVQMGHLCCRYFIMMAISDALLVHTWLLQFLPSSCCLLCSLLRLLSSSYHSEDLTYVLCGYKLLYEVINYCSCITIIIICMIVMLILMTSSLLSDYSAFH